MAGEVHYFGGQGETVIQVFSIKGPEHADISI